jgi:drug/metabolite transporter (DMT)-like permease
MNKNLKNGIIFSLITAIISGFSIFYNKLIIISGVDPLILNILKNGGAALILTVILFLSKPQNSILKTKKADWIKIILIALIGGSIPFVLYFEGLRSVSSINANIIHKTMFIWVAVMAIPLLGEKLKPLQIAGYFFLILSNIIIGNSEKFIIDRGIILILSATILWSIENILVKITLKNIDPKIIAWARMFFGTLILIVFAVYQNKSNLILGVNSKYIIPFSVSSILLASYIFSFYKALKYTQVTLVTSILIMATPITNILTSLFISHNLSQPAIINLLLTLMGIIFIIPILGKLNFRR